jgi:YVTN family beta-propeller protein
VIDTATATVIATIPVGSDPFAVAVNPAGTMAYVPGEGSNTVSVIDTATATVTATIPVGNGPRAVAFTPDGTAAYVVDISGNDVSVISTATGTVTATISVGRFPTGVAIAPDGTAAYVTDSSFVSANNSTVSVISTATGTVTATISGFDEPFGIAFPALAPASPPAVTSVSPVTGTTAGGTTVTISGTNLSRATAITFGAGHSATAVSCTATSCTATSPAGTAGTVDVQVTTPGGTSATSPADHYTYLTPFTFTGFLLPVLNPPFVNRRIAGRDSFMRFTLGGNKGLAVIAAGYPTTQQVRCRTLVPTGRPAPAASDGFTYTPLTRVYDYAWNTPAAFRGTCQKFTLTLTDGSTHTAYFAFLPTGPTSRPGPGHRP